MRWRMGVMGLRLTRSPPEAISAVAGTAAAAVPGDWTWNRLGPGLSGGPFEVEQHIPFCDPAPGSGCLYP